MSEPTEYLTPADVSKIIKKSEWSVCEYCKAGERVKKGFPVNGPYIKAGKYGREWRISRIELERFIGRAEGREVAER